MNEIKDNDEGRRRKDRAEKTREEGARTRSGRTEQNGRPGWEGEEGRGGGERAAERVVHVAWSQHRFPS